MAVFEEVCFWVAEVVPFLVTLATFIYGVKNFFNKGKALYLQIVTMGMGCYTMGSFYHLCQSITSEEVVDGFTAAYLGNTQRFPQIWLTQFQPQTATALSTTRL